MVNQSMAALGNHRSTIRELFEYGNQRAAVVGRENVFDFSLNEEEMRKIDALDDGLLLDSDQTDL